MLNTAYAYLVEQAVAADNAAIPAYQVAGVKAEEIASMSRRAALDDWLEAPMGDEAAAEAALVRALTA